MWQELENRVFKTRFIIQKNFKHLPSLKHSLTSPIGSDQRERESDQREGDQIRERERVRSERERNRSREPAQAAWPGLRGLGLAWPKSRDLATWVARLGLRDPGRASLGRAAQAAGLTQPRSCEPVFISSSTSFFFFLLALISFSAGAVLLYMGLKSSL